MKFSWSEEKNELLRNLRGISFEKVVTAYSAGNFHVIDRHPNQEKYPDQWILVLEVEDYLWRIPFVWQDSETIFLKTIYPSRKEMRKWNREAK